MEHTAESALRVIRRFRALAVTVLAALLMGMVFYHFVEDLRWLDGLYFSAMTLATVGYGDFTPQTDVGKIFTIVYVLFGIGLLGAFASNLLNAGLAQRWLRQQIVDKIEDNTRQDG